MTASHPSLLRPQNAKVLMCERAFRFRYRYSAASLPGLLLTKRD
jgi:hypothetical protein